MGIALLTPDRIKDDKRDDMLAVQRRSTALAEEENKIVTSINLTRDAAAEQKVDIDLELTMYTAQAEDRKKVIREEISALERQRDVILPPLEERRKAVERAEQGVLDRESRVTEREGTVRLREEAVQRREEAVPLGEQAVKTREEAIQPREEEQAKREETIKSSWTALNIAQDAHTEKVRVDAETAANVKAKNDADAAANATEREMIEKKKVEQANKDREIADRYAQLAKTAEELGIPQTP